MIERFRAAMDWLLVRKAEQEPPSTECSWCSRHGDSTVGLEGPTQTLKVRACNIHIPQFRRRVDDFLDEELAWMEANGK